MFGAVAQTVYGAVSRLKKKKVAQQILKKKIEKGC